jgi:hypothetical protein
VYSKRKKKRKTAEIEIIFSRLEIVVFHLLNKNPSVTPAAKILVFAKVRKNLSTKGAVAKNKYPAAIKTKDPRQ